MNGKRLIELGKDALILLLTLSAAYLLSMTPLVQDSGVLELFRPAEPSKGGTSGMAHITAAIPARMAVNTGEGRYGLQYDQDRLDEAFTQLSPLLGEALASAWTVETVSESQWRDYLGRTGIYFDFSGQMPLAALGDWLRGAGDCLLDGSARRMLLAADGTDGVLLCWQDETEGRFYAAATALSQRLHLEPAVESFAGNGAFFAFEDSGIAKVLKPYTLVTEGEQTVKRYTAANPLSSAEGTQALLEALSFSGRNHVAVSGGEAYLDGNDRLEVGTDGTVVYRAAQGEKYPVGGVTRGIGSEAEAVGAVWTLAERTIGVSCGEARLCLSEVQATPNGWRVSFSYRLNGAEVNLQNTGWAAEFQIQNGYVTNFTLCARCYTAAAEEALLLPIDRAAALLPGLTVEKAELVIQYRDRDSGMAEPAWVIEKR